MKAVIQGDFYCSKGTLLLYAIFTLNFALSCFAGLPHLMFFAFALTNMIIFKQLVGCESCGWEKYLVFSGIERKKQVDARFLESVALNLVTAAVYALMMAINTLFVKINAVLSAEQIFMFISLDILVGAAMSVLIGIYYVFGESKIRGAAYLIIILPMLLTMFFAAPIAMAVDPMLGLAEKNGAVLGAVFLASAVAVYAATYLASAAKFRKKELS